jgi:hypothetical protein
VFVAFAERFDQENGIKTPEARAARLPDHWSHRIESAKEPTLRQFLGKSVEAALCGFFMVNLCVLFYRNFGKREKAANPGEIACSLPSIPRIFGTQEYELFVWLGAASRW